MKKLIICFILLLFIVSCDNAPDLTDQSGKIHFFDKPTSGLNIVVKVGSAMPDRSNPLWATSWKDGQILEIQADDKYIGTATRKHFCIIHLQEDMNKYKDIKKYWHNPFTENIKRKRDYYIDFIALEKQGLISQSQLENIYNKQTETVLDFDMSFKEFEKYINHEDGKQRLFNKLDKGGTISAAGTYSIGTGMTYADLGEFEADLPANLTSPSVGGTVVGEFQVSEETDLDGTSVGFTHITNGSDNLKISVNSANRHSGVWTTNKAHIIAASGGISIGYYCYHFTMEYLQIDSGNGVNFGDNEKGTFTMHSCINKGKVRIYPLYKNSDGTYNVYNNVFTGGVYGIFMSIPAGQTSVANIFNNTIIKNTTGVYFYYTGADSATTIKNNVIQGNTDDWNDCVNATFTSTCNIVEQDDGPDVGYDSINLHDAVSNFVDYDNDNYMLVSGGSEIGTLDDATDPGTMPDVDIRGVARSTWYAGAFELELPSGRRIIINKSY